MKNLFCLIALITLVFSCKPKDIPPVADGAQVEGIVNMDAAALFGMISGFGGLDQLVPELVSACTVQGSGIGATRVLTLADGSGEVHETLSALDAENMSMSYSITSSPFPVTDYVGTMDVDAGASEGTSNLKWSSAYNVQDSVKTKMNETFTGIYNTAIAAINRVAAAQAEAAAAAAAANQ